jgi:hypothetical protein
VSIKPGLHFDMPNEDYHADTEWLSSSVLKAQLPEHYKQGGSQDALDFGTLFHTVVLEPDSLGGYVVLDAHAIAGNNPKTGKPYDAPHMTAKFKAAVAEAAENGHAVVSREDWDRAHAMRDAITEHPDAKALLLDGEGMCEESAFATDENGVKVKARFDRRIPGAIIDLKSTSAKPGASSLARAVIDYGYDLSAAHYLEVARLLELDADTFWFVFVGKEAPHRVTVANLDDTFLDRGRALRDLAIERLTDPLTPPYEGWEKPLTLVAPGWAHITPINAGIPADFTWSLDDYS